MLAQPQLRLDLGTMLAQCRPARGIVLELGRVAAHLLAQQREHGRGRCLARRERATGVTKIAKLDRVADAVGSAPSPADLNELIRPERVEPLDQLAISWRVENSGALPRREDRLGWHRTGSPRPSHIELFRMFVERRQEHGLSDSVGAKRPTTSACSAYGRICDDVDRLRTGVQGGRQPSPRPAA